VRNKFLKQLTQWYLRIFEYANIRRATDRRDYVGERVPGVKNDEDPGKSNEV